MNTHDELLDNVAAYALGLLPAAEAQTVIAHMQTCERCREEYRFLQPAVTAVAYSAEACADPAPGASAVSPLLKARIMKQVRGEQASPAAPARTPRLWPAYAMAAACLALAVMTGLVNLSLNGRLNHDRAENAAQAQMIADLTAPSSQHHRFSDGEVVTNGERLYIAMHGAPPPPPGHVYQAWTLAKGAKKMAPSMTFTPSADRVAMVSLPQAATTVAEVAVSIEPDGGSAQPTTKPLMVVTL